MTLPGGERIRVTARRPLSACDLVTSSQNRWRCLTSFIAMSSSHARFIAEPSIPFWSDCHKKECRRHYANAI
jgi:hypothetical protein